MKRLLLLLALITILPSSAANFQDINTIANDSAFRGRCLYALEVAAINVMAESASTAGHLQRVAYATTILNGSINSYGVALAVLTNSTVAGEATVGSLPGATSTVPDSDIQFSVNSVFSSLAGVSQN